MMILYSYKLNWCVEIVNSEGDHVKLRIDPKEILLSYKEQLFS